jgi:hypothetical protein
MVLAVGLRKTLMSKPAGTPTQYFLCDTVREAIQNMVGRYDDPDSTFAALVPVAAPNTGRKGKRDEAIIKHVLGQRDGTTVQNIGVAGKIWALMAFWPVVKKAGETAKTPKGVAGYFTGHENHGLNPILGALISAKESQKSGNSQISVYNADKALDLVKTEIAKRIHEEYFSAQRKDLVLSAIDSTFSRSHQSPQACATELIKALKIENLLDDGKKRQLSRHHIEGSVEKYINSRSSTEINEDPDINDTIKIIKDHLGTANSATPESQAPIVTLSGPEQSGKKSVIGDLLSQLKLHDDDSGYPQSNPVGNIVSKLPVLVISLRTRDYKTMASEVLAFLTRLSGPNIEIEDFYQHAKILKDRHCNGNSMDSIISEIKKFHAKPECAAMMIFLDAHELGKDSLSRIIQQSGLFRVLEALATTNSASRILLTVTDITVNWPSLLTNRRNVTVTMPKLKRLSWYLSVEAERNYKVKVGNTPSCEIRLRALHEKVIRGDVLLALSVILAINQTSGDKIYYLVNSLKDFSQNDGNSVDYGDSIFFELVERLDKLHVLPAIALISATVITSDSLTETTMYEMLKKIPKWDHDADKIRKSLVQLSDATQTLFIHHGPQSKINYDELGFGEDINEKNEVWNISPVMAMAIMRQLQLGDKNGRQKWVKIRESAFRLVAIAARRRAQLMRISKSEAASINSPSDMARDIQSYVALLASLPKDLSPYPVCEAKALRLSLDKIFTVTDFDPVMALQFAVYCMLLQDIDPEHRLSMVTDQDELRLRLYLLIFCPPGEVQTWRVNDLRGQSNLGCMNIFTEVPDYLMRIFGSSMVLEMLLSIAMAAYHCQVQSVLDWAWSRAQEVKRDIITKDEDKADNDKEWDGAKQILMTRLDCTVADMAILTGSLTIPLDAKDKGLTGAYTWIKGRASPLVEMLRGDPMDSNSSEDIFVQAALVRARMRVSAREAQLLWMARNDIEAAANTYERLEYLEHKLAQRMRHGEPVVMSGRTARRYARFLCGSYPIFQSQNVVVTNKDDITKKVRHVIEANIMRLNRYAGADRIGVLLDQAIRHSFVKNFDKAFWYVDKARERLNDSQISRAGRLDLLIVSIACKLEYFKIQGIDAKSAYKLAGTKELQDDLRELESEAKEMGFIPYQIISAILKLRAASYHVLKPFSLGERKSIISETSLLIQQVNFCSARDDLLKFSNDLQPMSGQ